MSDRVGFIGLGLMGKPMVLNLLKKGFAVTAHSRSQGPVDAVVAAGAERAATPADVASRSDVVITMVPDSPDVRLVLEGPNGVFETIRRGSVIIDMSTIAPAAAREFAAKAAERGVTMLDAPVSGGEIGAINGTLVDHGGRRRRRAGARPAHPRGDGQSRAHRPRRRRRGRAGLQGVQPDLHRWRAGVGE